MNLPNETKIRFCNAFSRLRCHLAEYRDCRDYTEFGNGDLCLLGKRIVAEEMVYANTDPELKVLP